MKESIKLTRKEYLQGGYDNLLGTILGFKRGRHKSNQFSMSGEFLSFLVFFDHRTGRIERFLLNTRTAAATNGNISPITPSIEEIKHIGNNPEDSFNNLFNGKLDRGFFGIFLFELVRDYLTTGDSYKSTDMREIRECCLPFRVIEGSSGRQIVGGGPDESITRYPDEWHPLNVQEFIKLDKSKKFTLLIPRIFFSRVLRESMLAYTFDLKPIESKSILPKCILDLKSSISSKLVTNSADLSTKVMIFNRNSVKYLRNKNNFKSE